MKSDIFIEKCRIMFIIRNMDRATHKKLQSIGLFKFNEVQKKIGISQSTFYRWVNKGLIKRISRGFYIHPQSSVLPEYLDFAIACSHFGSKSIIGGLSALFYYGLIEQAPEQVWLIVPPSRKDESSQKKYKCLRTHTSLRIGVDKKEYFKITSVERTLLEAMKFSTKIGQRTVMSSVRKALKERLTTEKKLAQMSSRLKMKNVLQKYWEAIVV